jgi:hypothetical protein
MDDVDSLLTLISDETRARVTSRLGLGYSPTSGESVERAAGIAGIGLDSSGS